MNTQMLMLGLLLIAGISFALPSECYWAVLAYEKYGCNFQVADIGWHYEYGYYTLAVDLADDEEQYAEYLENMAVYHHGTGPGDPSMYYALEGMGENECWKPGYVPPIFRTYMTQYNAYSFQFKREFNSFLRSYLSNNPEDKEEVRAYLAEIRQSYFNCINAEDE